MLKEKERKTASGFTYLVLLIVVFAACIWGMITLAQPAVAEANVGWIMALAFLVVLDVICLKGLFGVQAESGRGAAALRTLHGNRAHSRTALAQSVLLQSLRLPAH